MGSPIKFFQLLLIGAFAIVDGFQTTTSHQQRHLYSLPKSKFVVSSTPPTTLSPSFRSNIVASSISKLQMSDSAQELPQEQQQQEIENETEDKPKVGIFGKVCN